MVHKTSKAAKRRKEKKKNSLHHVIIEGNSFFHLAGNGQRHAHNRALPDMESIIGPQVGVKKLTF